MLEQHITHFQNYNKHKKIRNLHLLLTLPLILLLFSCGSGGGSSNSDNAMLLGLLFSTGILSPEFDSNTTTYTLTVTTDSITITPTANQSGATIMVNDIEVSSGTGSNAISLSAGNNIITIIVTAEDGTTQTYTITVTRFVALELLDPTPGAGDRFGDFVVPLGNGNIVVSDQYDSSIVPNNGAVHLYSPTSSTPIASTYGDNTDDLLSLNITALKNNNFVITSSLDDIDGLVDAGSVRLIDGTTGQQIGPTLAGDNAFDTLGLNFLTFPGVVLNNNNFIVISANDNENGIVNAGSLRLISGTTGTQIGPTLAGDVPGDFFASFTGSLKTVILENNVFAIGLSMDDEGGIPNVGTVRLIDGNTGLPIGIPLIGNIGESLSSFGLTALGNNNFVVASSNMGFGSIRLINGSTGAQIGGTLMGDVALDALGNTSVTALRNNNFVVASEDDDENGISDAGSVRLIDGNTGNQINVLAGDFANDSLGRSDITALGNNNFIITTSSDNENGIMDAGSVRLIDGSTGLQIGPTFAGDFPGDSLGLKGLGIIGAKTGTLALYNNNFIVASIGDTEGGIDDAGSVRLFDGNTGLQINAIVGDQMFDNLGSQVLNLENNNFVIASPNDDSGVINDAGSIRLVDGNTGKQINVISGEFLDSLGNGDLEALNNNNFVAMSEDDDENGVIDAGSARLIDGETGMQIGPSIVGTTTNDFGAGRVITPELGNYYILSLPVFDKDGLLDSGTVRIELAQ